MKSISALSVAIAFSFAWQLKGDTAPPQAEMHSLQGRIIEIQQQLAGFDLRQTSLEANRGDRQEQIEDARRVANLRNRFIYALEDASAKQQMDQGPSTSKLDLIASNMHLASKTFTILSLGDSLASGEGNPASGKDGWIDANFHRSIICAHKIVADAIHRANPSVAVNFIAFSASGATFDDLQQQIKDAGEQLGGPSGQKIDLVLISEGANDIHFKEMIRRFIWHGNPLSQLKAGTIERDCERDLDRFADAFAAQYTNIHKLLNVDDQDIFLSAVPDPLTDDSGNTSAHDILDDYNDDDRELVDGSFNHDDQDYARRHVIAPLNRQLGACCASNHWNFVAGTEALFYGHGYASSESNRWIRTAPESRSLQGDQEGTLHPNLNGHLAIAYYLLLAISHCQK